MSVPLEIRVAAVEEGLLDLQDTQARLAPLAGLSLEEIQRKFQALEEHLEEELLKTGKALRHDVREELSALKPTEHQGGDLPRLAPREAARQILDEVSQVKQRLEAVEALVPDLKSLYSGLEAAVQRVRSVKEVPPAAVAAVQEELRQTQAELSKGNLPQLHSKVESLLERLEVTSTVVRNDLGTRGSELAALKEQVVQMHSRFDGELDAWRLRLQQVSQGVEERICLKLSEFGLGLPQVELIDRMDHLETARAADKKEFQKLVKYVESSLNSLKDDLDTKMSEKTVGGDVSELHRELNGLKSAEARMSHQQWALAQHVEKICANCSGWGSCLRELQCKVAKLSEKTATQQLADSAADVEFSALKEQLASLWRQTSTLREELEVLSPAVKQDLMSWKQSISMQVLEHEGRLKSLAQTPGAQTLPLDANQSLSQLGEQLQLLRTEMSGLRAANQRIDVSVNAPNESSVDADWYKVHEEVGALRDAVQIMHKQSELQPQKSSAELSAPADTAQATASPAITDDQVVRQATAAPTVNADGETLQTSLAALSAEMKTSCEDWSKLQEKVAALQDVVQALPKQSELQALHLAQDELSNKFALGQATAAPTVNADGETLQTSLAALSAEMKTSREDWSKLQEKVAALQDVVQTLPKQSELQALHLAQDELSNKLALGQAAAAPTVNADGDTCQTSLAALSAEMKTSREDWSKLQEKVARHEKELTQFSLEDMAALRAEVQNLPRQSQVPSVHEQSCATSDLTKSLAEQCQELRRKQQENSELLSSMPQMIPEMIRKEVEQRLGLCDQRIESIQQFCRATLESLRESKLREEAGRGPSVASATPSPADGSFQETILHQLALGVLKMAQFLGVTTEDMCDKLGWQDAVCDLVRTVDHAWLKNRIPEKASVLKLLRQKADVEMVQGLQVLIEDIASGHPTWSPAEPVATVQPGTPSWVAVPPGHSETRQHLNVMAQVLQQLRRLHKVEDIDRPGGREAREDGEPMARTKKRPSYSGRSYSIYGRPPGP